jgi:hypothetical protein
LGGCSEGKFEGSLEPKLTIRGMLDDRQLDNWIPLLAIARHLGGVGSSKPNMRVAIALERDEGRKIEDPATPSYPRALG